MHSYDPGGSAKRDLDRKRAQEGRKRIDPLLIDFQPEVDPTPFINVLILRVHRSTAGNKKTGAFLLLLYFSVLLER